MISLIKERGGQPWKALALGLITWLYLGPPAVVHGQQVGCTCRGHPGGPHGVCPQHKRFNGAGTLGYGPPGVHPGFQGFGLGFHPGYGYGGAALGVGAEGGYPFYGGPGYPHCEPRLRRWCGINPSPFYAGPGYPTPCNPNFYGGIGGLAPDTPAITIGSDSYDTGYGGFTGAVPYPESALAPFTYRAAAEGTAGYSGAPNPITPQPATPNPDPGPPTPGSLNPPAVPGPVR